MSRVSGTNHALHFISDRDLTIFSYLSIGPLCSDFYAVRSIVCGQYVTV